MPAPDPNNEEERAAHIAKVLAAVPDYDRAGKKPPPVKRPRFPEVLPPAYTMTKEQIAYYQLQDCMNEIDFIKTPAHVTECLRHTRLHVDTYHKIVRYAWDRLRGQERDIQQAEMLLDQLGLKEGERGYGRKGEAYLVRAEHVGDEVWLSTATSKEMQRETELAGKERLEMELSEANLMSTAELEMEANCYWGTGVSLFPKLLSLIESEMLILMSKLAIRLCLQTTDGSDFLRRGHQNARRVPQQLQQPSSRRHSSQPSLQPQARRYRSRRTQQRSP